MVEEGKKKRGRKERRKGGKGERKERGRKEGKEVRRKEGGREGEIKPNIHCIKLCYLFF